MNSDLNRIEISKQYFELRNVLNSANRIKNFKSELEFELRENQNEYFIIIKSTAAEHGLKIASRNAKDKFWVLFENNVYEDFFKYMFLKARTLQPDDDKNINFILTDFLRRLWIV